MGGAGGVNQLPSIKPVSNHHIIGPLKTKFKKYCVGCFEPALAQCARPVVGSPEEDPETSPAEGRRRDSGARV